MRQENVEKLRQRVEVIIDNAKLVQAQVDSLEDWNSFKEVIESIHIISDFVVSVVMAVEIAADDIADDLEGLESDDKLNTAVEFLDDLIELPWYLETIDGPMFKVMISMAVYWLNKRYGHNWRLERARVTLAMGEEIL